MNTPSSNEVKSQRNRFVGSLLNGSFLGYAYFSIMALIIIAVIGSIVIKAIDNHGLIPKPNTLESYECAGPSVRFSFYYLHGTNRVRIKSPNGILEGTVEKNQFDWGAFNDDATMVGFLPPARIVFEDAQTLTINGPGYKEISCTLSTAHTGHRRAIVE